MFSRLYESISAGRADLLKLFCFINAQSSTEPNAYLICDGLLSTACKSASDDYLSILLQCNVQLTDEEKCKLRLLAIEHGGFDLVNQALPNAAVNHLELINAILSKDIAVFNTLLQDVDDEVIHVDGVQQVINLLYIAVAYCAISNPPKADLVGVMLIVLLRATGERFDHVFQLDGFCRLLDADSLIGLLPYIHDEQINHFTEQLVLRSIQKGSSDFLREVLAAASVDYRASQAVFVAAVQHNRSDILHELVQQGVDPSIDQYALRALVHDVSDAAFRNAVYGWFYLGAKADYVRNFIRTGDASQLGEGSFCDENKAALLTEAMRVFVGQVHALGELQQAPVPDLYEVIAFDPNRGRDDDEGRLGAFFSSVVGTDAERDEHDREQARKVAENGSSRRQATEQNQASLVAFKQSCVDLINRLRGFVVQVDISPTQGDLGLLVDCIDADGGLGRDDGRSEYIAGLIVCFGSEAGYSPAQLQQYRTMVTGTECLSMIHQLEPPEFERSASAVGSSAAHWARARVEEESRAPASVAGDAAEFHC